MPERDLLFLVIQMETITLAFLFSLKNVYEKLKEFLLKLIEFHFGLCFSSVKWE
jgi:hypothetical protein